jgi:hypothetical protein
MDYEVFLLSRTVAATLTGTYFLHSDLSGAILAGLADATDVQFGYSDLTGAIIRVGGEPLVPDGWERQPGGTFRLQRIAADDADGSPPPEE